MADKRDMNIFFEKSCRKVWRVKKKSVPLHSQLRNRVANKIGIWCNGNTADSGPAFPGSNPGIPTKESQASFLLDFFVFGIFQILL